MPTSASAGHDLVEEDPLHRAGREPAARSRISSELLRRACARRATVPARPAATWSFSPATRTWKNSSRFWLKMARNLARSSSGTCGSLGQGQHPRVEVEPGQLAVQQAVSGSTCAARYRGRSDAPRAPDRVSDDGGRRRRRRRGQPRAGGAPTRTAVSPKTSGRRGRPARTAADEARRPASRPPRRRAPRGRCRGARPHRRWRHRLPRPPRRSASCATGSPSARALANTPDFIRPSPADSTSAVCSPPSWRRRASASMPTRPAYASSARRGRSRSAGRRGGTPCGRSRRRGRGRRAGACRRARGHPRRRCP